MVSCRSLNFYLRNLISSSDYLSMFVSLSFSMVTVECLSMRCAYLLLSSSNSLVMMLLAYYFSLFSIDSCSQSA